MFDATPPAQRIVPASGGSGTGQREEVQAGSSDGVSAAARRREHRPRGVADGMIPEMLAELRRFYRLGVAAKLDACVAR
jgi:hypothetical protein